MPRAKYYVEINVTDTRTGKEVAVRGFDISEAAMSSRTGLMDKILNNVGRLFNSFQDRDMYDTEKTILSAERAEIGDIEG